MTELPSLLARANTSPTVQFHMSTLGTRELQYVKQAAQDGHLHGDGPFTARCSAFLEKALLCKHVLLTTSCTHALELAGLLLDLQPGDEVIVPSFTFVSTATAFLRAGARLTFVDIRPDTLNLDERLLEAAVTSRTRAIVPVHYAGVGCDMTAIGTIARRHGLSVIEDNAHGVFGRYDGHNLGTIGNMGCLSFHKTKNFTCGEGGALLLNEPNLAARAEVIREKGTNRRAFMDGRVDKYCWVDVGSSYLPSDILAAFLLAQLESWEEKQERRRQLWTYYADSLTCVLSGLGVRLPFVPGNRQQAYHLFYLITRSHQEQISLLQHLRSAGVEASFHYQPLHSSPAGSRYGYSADGCPVTTEVSERILRLPFHLGLTRDAQDIVIEALKDFYQPSRALRGPPNLLTAAISAAQIETPQNHVT